MKNTIYQDDEFDQFLQDSVKQHRMYPSDHIWKNIRTQIHGYRAWPALTFIALFVITALTISTLLSNHPDTRLLTAISAAESRKAANAAPAKSPALIATEKNSAYMQQTAPAQMTAEAFADTRPEETLTDAAETVLPTPHRDVIAAAVRPAFADKTIDKLSFTHKENLQAPKTQSAITPAFSATEDEAINGDANTELLTKTADEPAKLVAAQPALKKTDAHSTADDFLKDFAFISNTPPRNKNSRVGFQIYATPSTSYRRLSDEKVKDIIQPAVSSLSIPSNQNSIANVNDVVRHRPAMGLEVGFSLLYNMTKKLKFKTGLQLDIRQYYIETFQSLTNDLSSLSLINYKGVETISFYTPYNNNTGYKKTQLDNKIYQLALPLGVQWDIAQSKHLGINAEASIQPTLTLNTDTYLLSTDYKHYTNGNDLIRKWNINTSMGLNITYKSGSLMYTIGPQIRYQHLPTYSNLYPIKEYLMDYGVRFGITKQLP